MANIAIVGADSTNAANIKLKEALIANSSGHTCLIFREDSTAPLTSYDLIITSRVVGGVSANANIVAAFNSGVPVICGMNQVGGQGLGASADFLAGKIGLLSSLPPFDTASIVESITNSFYAGYDIGTRITPTSGGVARSFFYRESLAPGAVVYFSDQQMPTTKMSVAIATRGSENLIGGTFPAACAFAGFLYTSSSGYSPQGVILIQDLVKKVLEADQPYSVTGNVSDSNGSGLVKRLFIYNQGTGVLHQTTMSDTNGDYKFSVSADTDYFVVCSTEDPANNFKIHAFVQGVL